LPGNGDEKNKGNTKSFDLGTSFVFRHWNHTLSYSRVKGYYLENTKDFQSWSAGDPYIQFPDLVYTGFSYTIGYNLNPKLSIKSITTQTERQLKPAGSLMPVAILRYYVIDDKSTQSEGTQKSKNIEWSIGAGYYYTYVIDEKIYASLALSPNIGFTHVYLTTRFSSGDIKANQNNLTFRWDGTFTTGYDARDFFTGLHVSLAGIFYRQENTSVYNDDLRVFYQLFFGVRLKAPRFLKKFVTDIENILPIL
jgi:hypothetical protein